MVLPYLPLDFRELLWEIYTLNLNVCLSQFNNQTIFTVSIHLNIALKLSIHLPVCAKTKFHAVSGLKAFLTLQGLEFLEYLYFLSFLLQTGHILS